MERREAEAAARAALDRGYDVTAEPSPIAGWWLVAKVVDGGDPLYLSSARDLAWLISRRVVVLHRTELERAIEHWEKLAEEQDRWIAEGLACCPEASQAKAQTYRATAKALRLELETGKPHCSCCLKPRGGHR